jgi:hypothetical protein
VRRKLWKRSWTPITAPAAKCYHHERSILE